MIKMLVSFVTPSLSYSAWLVLFMVFSLSANAQNVKIYVFKDTTVLWDKKYRSEIYWGFYKVDIDKKTVQANSFVLRDGDKAPNLTNLNNLFKNEPKDLFVILSATKIKAKRVKSTRVNRAWNDFATSSRSGGSQANLFFINRYTLSKKKR